MPINLLKEYSSLLELSHLSDKERRESLRGIFNRDIENNEKLDFKGKIIRPLKREDGLLSMDVLFNHLTTMSTEDHGVKKRIFESDRSMRLHWIRFFLECRNNHEVEIFSTIERDIEKRKNVSRTYIYDVNEKYVIVLEPQRSELDYYLLTAYYLNKSFAKKQMRKKIKNKLPNLL